MEEETKLMFNLQLFAEDSGGDDNGGKGGEDNKGKDGAGGGDPENKPDKTGKNKDVEVQAKIDEALKTANNAVNERLKGKLDASRCSGIYGCSSTVQPSAHVVHFWQRTK